MIATPRGLTSRLRAARATGYVGVDIGAHAIKVAQVQREGRSWKLLSARALPHRQPLDFTMPQRAIEQIIDTLDRVWVASGRWFADDAACLLPMSTVACRTLNLPAASPSEQQSMITEELADETGIAAGDWSVACWPDEIAESDGQTTSVSALGVSQELAEGVLEALLSRGLACELMTGHPQIQARSVSLTSQPSSSSTVAVVDWGHEQALLTIVSCGNPVYTRVLRNCGFRHVIEAVAGSLNLEHRDVPPLICGSTVADSSDGNPLQKTILDMAAAPLKRFHEEVTRTLSYVRQQRASLDSERIVLYGGGATLRGVEQLVHQATRVPTTVWDCTFQGSVSLGSRTPPALLAPAIVLSTLRWDA